MLKEISKLNFQNTSSCGDTRNYLFVYSSINQSTKSIDITKKYFSNCHSFFTITTLGRLILVAITNKA